MAHINYPINKAGKVFREREAYRLFYKRLLCYYIAFPPTLMFHHCRCKNRLAEEPAITYTTQYNHSNFGNVV
jgi:hypothetical protein